MMNPVPWLQMTNMISYQGLVRTFPKCFMVPRIDIEAENYDLSLSRYKEEIFEEVQYEQPEAILERLIQAEVGNVDKKVLNKVQSGILYELLELKGMIV